MDGTQEAMTDVLDATSAILALCGHIPQFKEGEVYRDAVGRRWKVTSAWYGGSILMLKRYLRPWTGIQVAVVDEGRPGTATVMLDEGFTTIYADTEGER